MLFVNPNNLLTFENCLRRLIRAPLPNGLVTLAWNAIVGHVADRIATHFCCKRNDLTVHDSFPVITIGFVNVSTQLYLGRVKQIWYLSSMWAAKVQARLRIRAVSPEPPMLAHTSSESRGTFRQKARSLAPLNGWACAVKICHDGMLQDTDSFDAPQLKVTT